MSAEDARSQAATEWDLMDLDQYDEDEFIRDYPTLDESGYPVEDDLYASDAAKALTGHDTERAEWIELRVAEILGGATEPLPVFGEAELETAFLDAAEEDLQRSEALWDHYLGEAELRAGDALYKAHQTYVRRTAQ